MTPRISKIAGRSLAAAAFDRDADRRLRPEHLALWKTRGAGGRYEMTPQPGEWEPIIGTPLDPRMHYEFGFILVDERAGRQIIVCRALVHRDEAHPTVTLDWYPAAIDPRKRPD